MKKRLWLLLTFLIGCLFATFTARAELYLTNYTAAHPLKVLCSGDSITDDSSMPGAWRSYLEKLLVTNGYVFTNLGRWSTTGVSGFVQVHHEGMDSAVIGAPGVGGSPHGYTAANNYTLKTLSDALTNAFFPDLVLIDMGVNDMGRGRDPYHVATNDLSALLDLIFTKVPNAHIIVSKPTTITYSTILSPPYQTYRTNMLAYCDAVQALATARRARGQNVYVADLFSAVGANLISDGTHPNATGFSRLASEMMFRIASITARPDYVTTPFILGGSTWKYSDQGSDLGTNWSQPAFDDSTWSEGAGRLGYGVFGTTTVNYGPDPNNKYITTYFRHAFVVPATTTYTNLAVRLNRLDGAVVYLNGNELYRVNLPVGTITYQTKATTSPGLSGDYSNTYYPTNFSFPLLPAGTNVIAVEIHRWSPSGPVLTFDLELFGTGVYTPPTLSFTSTPGAVQLAWPSDYTSFNLQSSTDLSSNGMWQLVPGPYPVSNNLFEVSIPTDADPAQFFRLIKPGS